jgi:hypothetical protein
MTEHNRLDAGDVMKSVKRLVEDIVVFYEILLYQVGIATCLTAIKYRQ